MDPLSEKYYNISPYAYCFNNPLKFIDKNGREGAKYVDKDGNKHIESNVIVLLEPLKEIPTNISAKKAEKLRKVNEKINRNNNRRVENVTKDLSEIYGGKSGLENSKGQKVFFTFNVQGIETNLYKTTSSNQIYSIAESQGISAKTPSRIAGSFGYGEALPVVYSQGSAGGVYGVATGPLVRTNLSQIPEYKVFGHEVGHTFNLPDNYNDGGIMASPPNDVSPSEVDEIWDNAFEKK